MPRNLFIIICLGFYDSGHTFDVSEAGYATNGSVEIAQITVA